MSSHDHRVLAEDMELYFIDEQIGAGLPVWLPNGVAIRDSLESFVKELERRDGYQRVVSPHLAKAELYEQSGHLAHYESDMFPPLKSSDEACYYLKPMNCPHHHKVFSSSLRSYRQLPLRIAEYGQVYRNEPSGSLRGLSRVRGLCQNDAHIYVDPEGAFDEIVRVLRLHERCYQALGLQNYRYRLSKGEVGQWEEPEEILRCALRELELPFFEADGEAAFYGPKIDVQMRLGSQDESIASVQLDVASAARFGLRFVSSSGESKEPWIIHRAPLGSHERFVAMLLEVFEGRLPGWLAPVQLFLLPLSEAERDFAHAMADDARAKGLRVHVDESLGSLSKRIHFGHRLRPFAKAVIGAREVAERRLKLQLRDRNLDVSLDVSPSVSSGVSSSVLSDVLLPLVRAPL